MKKLLILCFSITLLFTQSIRPRPADWGRKIINSDLDNLYKISDQLYRSANPDDSDIPDIKALKIKGILNLRYYHDDADDLENNDLVLKRVKMKAHKVTVEEVIEALKFIIENDGATLVHCLHGSDRTGTVVAAYRIVVQNWSKEKALDEMQNGGYGFHEIFDNLPKLIMSFDVKKMKKELNLK